VAARKFKRERRKQRELAWESRYYTIPEYCHEYRCSRATYYYSHAPHLKKVKFAGTVLIDKAYADQVAERFARVPGDGERRAVP
jgi:hypothetical protein